MLKKSTLLLALLLLWQTTGCGRTETPETSSVETETEAMTETEPAETEPVRPTYDFGGANYTILQRTDTMYEFVAELNGEIVGDSVYERNLAVTEGYNINLATREVNGDWDNRNTFISTIEQAVLAGEDSYQLIAGYNGYITTLITSGYLLDMYTTGIDFSTPWWCAGFNDNVEIADRLYFCLGDASLTMWDGMEVVFFNKKLAGDYGITSPYTRVADNTWLFDTMRADSALVSADLNGDNVQDAQDLWGTIFYNVRDIPVYFGSAYCSFDENGEPYLSLYDEHIVAVFERAQDFLNTSGEAKQFSPDEDQLIFSSDRALYFQGPLRYATLFRDNTSDFGIVPFPKYSAEQNRYYTTVIDSLSVFTVPSVAADPAFCGTVLDGLCAYSLEMVVPAYYEKALKSKYARDMESEEMLNLVKESVWFDFGFVYSQSLGDLGSFFDIVKSDSSNITSSWESKKNSYQKALDALLDYMKQE